MSEKKYLGLLAGACGVLAILCVIAFTGKKSLSGKTIDTVLLNEKYGSQLACVEVVHQDTSLTFYKKELSGKSLWIGLDADGSQLVFPVDSTLMEEFLAAMMELRNLSLVSQKQDQKTLESFGFASEEDHAAEHGHLHEAYDFRFQLQDGRVVSQVLFGDKNYSGYRVYLKTPESPIYLTQDDFYPWLSVSAKSWAEMDLISRQLLGISGEKDVQGLEITLLEQNGVSFHKNIAPTNTDFSAKVSRLLSLRGGSLIEPSVVFGKRQLGEIALYTGRGSQAVLQIFEGNISQLDQDVSSYYVIPQIHSLDGSSVNLQLDEGGHNYGFEISGLNYGFEIRGLNYGFEISPWTWESLQVLAQD